MPGEEARSFQEQRSESVRSGSDRMWKLSGEAQVARKVEDGAGGEVCAERHSHRGSMGSGGTPASLPHFKPAKAYENMDCSADCGPASTQHRAQDSMDTR